MDEVLQWKHKCVALLTCNKGCGTQIYFDPNNKSSSGKLIPMEVATHENHTCGGRQQEAARFFNEREMKFVSCRVFAVTIPEAYKNNYYFTTITGQWA